MTKRASAKYKLDRRMGQNIWGRPKSPVNRREYGPGQHGQRRICMTAANWKIHRRESRHWTERIQDRRSR